MQNKYFTPKNITRMAIFTALSIVLYFFVKFPLPFFPPFLDMQVSDLPALLAGFMMGPISGSIIIVFRMLIKLPFSTTGMVGELADLLMGLAFVLPSSLIYKYHRTLKGAIISLIVGVLATTIMGVFSNYFMLIPFFVNVMFGGSITPLVNSCQAIYPHMTESTFYFYYLLYGVLPFNLLRALICALLTYLLYKKLEKIFDKLFPKVYNNHMRIVSKNEKQTLNLGKKIARSLKGGEVITLNGELGAGKTVLTKGIALGLKITQPITSPTFTIMNEYEGKIFLYHYDAYRLTSGREAYEAGLGDYIGDKGGVCVIEWADNIKDILPSKLISININYLDENKREIIIND